jgi:hypothetical protein
MLIGPTITDVAAVICAGEGLSPASPATGLSPRPGWAATGGGSSGPGPGWVASGACLGGFRRLWIRSERSSERLYALARLACAVICFNALLQPPW